MTSQDDVEIYLDYIRSLGIEAWIPDSTSAYGPKMSVADQCRSKVLCLNYNGSDIYIRGNTCDDRTNNQAGTTLACPVTAWSVCKQKNHSTTKRSIENNLTETGNLIPAAISDSTVSMKNLKRSVGVQWSINDSLGMGKVSSKNLEKSIKTIGHIENEHFALGEGVQYKRIVREKLTREVRVAKQYVSTLTNHNLGNGSTLKSDCSNHNSTVEVEKPWPTRGHVRQLVKCFYTSGNVEKQ